MNLKTSFKLYQDFQGVLHIASPTHLTALCGQNTFGCPTVHPSDAGAVCAVCTARHDNVPGAWQLPNYGDCADCDSPLLHCFQHGIEIK